MFFSFGRKKTAPEPEKPFRAEILSREACALRAAELAETHTITYRRLAGVKLQKRFKENTRVLSNAYFAFAEAARNKEVLPAGAEWLLDNYHIIDEQVRGIRRDLPKSYYKALPKLTDAQWLGYPRVYQLVCDFISHADATVDIELLTVFIQAYQTKSILKIGEIWAVPIMLRLALVENLRRLALSSMEMRAHRNAAEQFCKEAIDASGSVGTELLLSLVARLNQNPALLDHSAAYIIRRLRAKGAAGALALQWVDEKLRERGIDPNDLARQEQQSQAADQISVGNSVTALKTIGSINWREWFERVSKVDEILRRDPAGVYEKSDFYTRDLYRHELERLARRSRRAEVEVADELVRLAGQAAEEEKAEPQPDPRFYHVGYFLIDDGLEQFEKVLKIKIGLWHRLQRLLWRHVTAIYLGSIALLTLFGLALALQYSINHQAGLCWLLLVVLLFTLPLSELAILIVQWFVTRLVAPLPLPKLDLDEGVPDELRTVVAVQTMLTDVEALERTIEALKIRFIGNQDKNILFALLADLPDAPQEVLAGDRGLVTRAGRLIADLNRQYCQGTEALFYVLFRKRLWNEKEGKFMAWERKRGKIMEFNRWLRGAADTTFNVVVGDTERLKTVQFVITLDNDTQLPPGSAAKLIATIAHPLNRAIFDEKTNVVRKGYAIVQPRVGITLSSGNASVFARIFSGHAGLDPYTRTVSDVYQDLFKEGSYIGKGIYHVDSFERALHKRVPENSLLSHDLFEGLFARTALASDIELFDEFPMRYHAQARRQHRWIRGDWQLLPWLGRYVPDEGGVPYASPFSALGRWKLLDNLRRSLVPVSLFLALIVLLNYAPGPPLAWLFALAVLIGFPVYIVMLQAVIDFPLGYSLSSYAWGVWNDLHKNMLLVFLQLVFLPHQALIAAHAIIVTLYRLWFSRRHLLEWETAYAAERRLGGDMMSFIKTMWPVWPLILALQLGFNYFRGLDPSADILVFLVWYLSPIVAWWVSQPPRTALRLLLPTEKQYLRDIAYATWKYFDTFLRPEYNFLIPDNLQVVPRRVVAERTSPTNISLSVLSVISAYDLGFIPLGGAMHRLRNIFAALQKLERFHGHFLNWYEVRGLKALSPRYVSMVDSGNLAGHLIAAQQAIRGFGYLPILAKAHIEHLYSRLRGIPGLSPGALAGLRSALIRQPSLESFISVLNSVDVLRSDLLASGASEELLRQTEEFCDLRGLVNWSRHLPLIKQLGEKEVLHKRFKSVERVLRSRVPSLVLLLKLTNRLLKLEQVVDSSRLEADEREQFKQLVSDLKHVHALVTQLLGDIEWLDGEISKIISEIDFGFLFDSQKKLMSIGYNVESGRRDNSYYDLLASEARLGSLVAIAKGDIPQSHWFLMNRALTKGYRGKALLSWSATMFEYLMPLLVMKDFAGTLLSETNRVVVRSQRRYARQRGVPWGMSESAYSGVDFEKTYQYRAFGVPGLGLKRGLGDDLVVSPYSTLLALAVEPVWAVKNLKRLERYGLRGEFGFYEAVDFTKERLGGDETQHIVKSFLAHHQGMSLVAINNCLNHGIFQERFHSDPRIKARELLLQERFPSRIPVIIPHQAERSYIWRDEVEGRLERGERFKSARTRYPRMRLLANGHYSLCVDNGGANYSLLDGEIALTRMREDWLQDNCGSWIYIRDLRSRAYWSATYEPTRTEPEEYEVIFNPDKIEFRRRDQSIVAHTEITVSPEDNVEVRRITMTNLSNKMREMEVTSYGELALAPRGMDLSHPAFARMFVESEYLEEYDALIFSRRPRGERETPLFLAHLISMPVVWSPTQYETARSKFIGRGRNVSAPRAMQTAAPLTGTLGTVLDPVFALRTRLELESGESQTVHFVTIVSRDREELLQLIKRYHEGQAIARAFEMAWSHSDVELRTQQYSIARVHAFQRLANALICNIDELRAPSDILKKNRLSQAGLWRFGVSGDEPIVLLVLNDPDQIRLAEELLLAHEYLRQRGLRFDLVILNEYPGGYLQNFQEELEIMIKTGYARDYVDRRGGVFLRAVHHLSEEEVTLLYAVARVVLHGNKGSLPTQLVIDSRLEPVAGGKRSAKREQGGSFRPPTEELEFNNGLGGFSDGGRAYTMVVDSGRLPPQPWSNVIANREFGFLVTESGSGFTWAENSAENRISAWSNDAVTDPFGEVLYLRDQESGAYWCPTPRPLTSVEAVKVKHAFGFSEFSTQVNQIFSKLTISGATDERVKWWHLELVNGDFRPRTIELFFYLEWVLGNFRENHYRYLQTSYDREAQIVCVSNPFNIDFSSQVVFVGCNHNLHSFTTSRKEFIGRHGDVTCPVVLEQPPIPAALSHLFAGGRATAVSLSGTVGAGFDSCAALKVQVSLAPAERHYVLFYLGQAASLTQARTLAGRYKSLKNWSNALEQVKRQWAAVTNSVQVRTPVRSFDLLLNGWLLYQTMSGRLFARSGFYQSSGAYGFRDQLQDSLALLWSRPEETRRQILLHASRQYLEGDVQHWWHPPAGRGIRTRISDNYLWLPYAVLQYLNITEDYSVLEERVGFLEGPLLQDDEVDNYHTPRVSNREATVYEHCIIALDRALVTGPHGLPLIGSGDWNDGFNAVGVKGKGESVWLGWFLAHILSRFVDLVEQKKDRYRAGEYREKARGLIEAIEKHGWDGAWYRRAYFDNGTPIGSAENNECSIDSLTQSWSVICGQGDMQRQRQAMKNVYTQLVKRDCGLICLLWPPFNRSTPSPGYIRGYPPGIRENGGQYTHAAAWVILAAALLGDGGRAMQMFEMINPINHTRDNQAVLRYQAEPYVLCGDVYSVPPHVGRGGWSWYTGSSAWMYRIAVEQMMGLKMKGSFFTIEPCIPSEWREYALVFQREGITYEVKVLNPNGVQRGVKSVEMDGKTVPDFKIGLLPKSPSPKKVSIVVTMG